MEYTGGCRGFKHFNATIDDMFGTPFRDSFKYLVMKAVAPWHGMTSPQWVA